jgi:hypothetical protein
MDFGTAYEESGPWLSHNKHKQRKARKMGTEQIEDAAIPVMEFLSSTRGNVCNATALVKVRPDDAAWILNRLAEKQRNRSLLVVERYARSMREGRWSLNGATLAFSSEGQLLDGQHRLAACAKSGAVFTTFAAVVEDDGSAYQTLDIGLRRTSGHILQAHGIRRNSQSMAVTAKWVILLREFPEDVSRPGKHWRDMDHAQVVRTIDQFPIIESATVFMSRRTVRGLCRPSGAFAALYVLFAEKDKMMADEFFKRLLEGEGLTKDEPIWHLRRYLQNEQGNGEWSNYKRVTACAKCWNAMRRETWPEMRILKVSKTPEMVEIR